MKETRRGHGAGLNYNKDHQWLGGGVVARAGVDAVAYRCTAEGFGGGF